MGWIWSLVMLATVATVLGRTVHLETVEDYVHILPGLTNMPFYTVDDDHKDGNLDRLMTICEEGRMHIHLRRDFNNINLRGPEPECKPRWTNFTDYDGTVVRVQTWTLPLVEGANGPCGLRFTPGNGTDAYNVTLYGPASDFKREAQCIRTGLLDKRGAHIRIATITPMYEQRNLTVPRPTARPTEPADVDTVAADEVVGGTVEVLQRQTLSARFHHRMPAGISLWPDRCWIVNERRRSRRLVVDRGCPLCAGENNEAIVSVGSESSTEVSGDVPHLFFNADHALFENEDPSDLPPFHVQCEVFPCKGDEMFMQVIGVARCPSMQWCDSDRELSAFQPKDVFEINLPFSIAISRSAAVAPDEYRHLGMPVYPSQFWWYDMVARHKMELAAAAAAAAENSAKELQSAAEGGCPLLIISIVVVVFLLICVVCALLCRWWSRNSQRAKAFVTSADSPLPLVGNEPIIILERDWKCIKEKRAALLRGWTEESH